MKCHIFWQPVIISVLEEHAASILVVDDGGSIFFKKYGYVATKLHGIKSHKAVMQSNLSVMNMVVIR
jgi:hypothetical protein